MWMDGNTGWTVGHSSVCKQASLTTLDLICAVCFHHRSPSLRAALRLLPSPGIQRWAAQPLLLPPGPELLIFLNQFFLTIFNYIFNTPDQLQSDVWSAAATLQLRTERWDRLKTRANTCGVDEDFGWFGFSVHVTTEVWHRCYCVHPKNNNHNSNIGLLVWNVLQSIFLFASPSKHKLVYLLFQPE